MPPPEGGRPPSFLQPHLLLRVPLTSALKLGHCLFARAVIYSGCATERLFSKASKALQLTTLGYRHLSCCNFRTSCSDNLTKLKCL